MQAATTVVLDAYNLQAALARWCGALEAAAPELNALDGQLGDGDLGTTLDKCAANVRALLQAPPAQLNALLKACAQACARASGSSFGTLLAVGFLSAAKGTAGRESLDAEALAQVLAGALQALSDRGGAALGDKTMLDSLYAIIIALQKQGAGAEAPALKAAALAAAGEALEAFRGQPNRIGRARMFAERSVGMNDPGMVAVQRMVQAL
jgi:dihydroxyacetone kinase-like protein